MPPMRNTHAEIEIGWYPALRDAAGPLSRALPDPASGPLPIVPSSLRRDDRITITIRRELRDLGARTTVLLPRPATALMMRRGGGSWHAAAIDGHRVWVGARLVRSPWIALATVDAARHTGPFVLDLPARFLHPANRIRLAARPDRLRALADVAAIAPPAASLVLTPVGGGWLAVTTRDPIAAELWALGLAERFHDIDIEMQGPWEEPAVQRATELGLGIRIPDDMRITLDLPPGAATARSLLRRTAERLGHRLDARQPGRDGRTAGSGDNP